MICRWLRFDPINPHLELTTQQRKAVRQRALKLTHEASMTWQTTMSWLVPMVIMWIPFNPLILRLWMPSSMMLIALAFLLPFVLACLTGVWLRRWSLAHWINLALGDLGHEVCPKCGYYLQPLPPSTMRCPECGQRRLPMPKPPLAHEALEQLAKSVPEEHPPAQ